MAHLQGSDIIMSIHRTVDDWERELGSQFRAARINADLDQLALAELAGVSVGAVRNLERGAGSSLATVVRVARALDRTDWLQSFAPAVAISPLDALAQSRRGERAHRRMRVSPRRKAG
ncbi:MAG: helix-turn-helix transcriptional regulator [Ilumatobacteraceae bacterium]